MGSWAFQIHPTPLRIKFKELKPLLSPQWGLAITAICNVNAATVPYPLDRMGRYLQLRNVGRNRRNNTILAQMRWLRGGLLRGQFRHFSSVTRHAAQPRDDPVTRQPKPCFHAHSSSHSTGFVEILGATVPRISPERHGQRHIPEPADVSFTCLLFNDLLKIVSTKVSLLQSCVFDVRLILLKVQRVFF